MCFNKQVTELVNLEDKKWYKRGLIRLHTRSVRSTIEEYLTNKVLSAAPPEFSTEGAHLPRGTRSTLAQLRSGYSKHLRSYFSRIKDDTPDACLDCGSWPHNTEHLFKCPRKPTTLDVRSLWDKPVAAATFLGLRTGI